MINQPGLRRQRRRRHHQRLGDEEGTETAAVTSVEVGATSVQPNIFRVDRPFVFLIHDDHSGALLFAGKIVSPPNS